MDDFERAEAALAAIRLIREAYASGPPGPDRIEDILVALELGRAERSFERHIAAAIRRWLNNQPVS